VTEAAIRLIVSGLEDVLPTDGATALVSASVRGSGTTTVSRALAEGVTRSGRRVLLVRAHGSMEPSTRRPWIVRRLQLEDGKRPPGDDATPVPIHGEPFVLSVAGSDGNGGSIGTAIREVVAEARGRFDVVLIDAPPLLDDGWSDSMIGALDCVVFVAASDDHIDRVREGALVAESLRADLVVTVGNRMTWSTR
jgi:Mrp family chromosome partitioning ATPase